MSDGAIVVVWAIVMGIAMMLIFTFLWMLSHMPML